MGGCSAPFCNNSSKKGYIMKVFPRDPERRALWLRNVNRKNWTPTDNSYLCEVHFSPEMWERRKDNKPKLKPYAVPTIFGYFIKEKVRENEKDTQKSINTQVNNSITHSCESFESYESRSNDDILDKECHRSVNNACDNAASIVHTDIDIEQPTNVEPVNIGPEKEKDSETMSTVQNKNDQITNISKPSTSVSSAFISSKSKFNKENKDQEERWKEIIRRQQLSLIKMRKKVKSLRNMMQILKTKVNNDKYRKALSTVFTDDQIEALCTKSQSVRNWSNETIERALQLKFVCGANGYNELIRQKIPLPSLRTLRRRLDYSKSQNQCPIHKKLYFENESDLESELVFDEMVITSEKCYDSSTGSLTGDATIPNEEGCGHMCGMCKRGKHSSIWPHPYTASIGSAI